MNTIDIETITRINDVEAAVEHLYSLIPPTKRISTALEYAREAHKNQCRKSGEPYIVHPVLVASIVAAITGDEAMVVAALLHDVVEDTHITSEDVERDYGEDVANLVEGLTKIDTIRDAQLIPSNSDEKLVVSALSFRKMLIASIEDVRVLVVKLCDRLHNMLTLGALSPAKQHRIAEETLVVYAPIANRLGISFLKNQLEDLSFQYLFKEEKEAIDLYLEENYRSINSRLSIFCEKLTKMMLENGFNEEDFQILSRVKHDYSIYLKMQRKGISIDEILDLLAVRILVKKPIDCYRVFGLVHLNFQPLSSRFKDYISIPKENGYQTLHTTVFHDSAIFEVQIRTYEMHKTAELGVAAHWKYKNGGNNPISLEWLHNLQYQNESVEAFYELIKNDLFSDDISVFSPKGKSFTLPRGAVALDFAYAVHTEVGDTAEGCYINKEKASLLTELHNGDIVKITTAPKKILRCSWLDAVKTSRAKASMRANCNQRIRMIDAQSGINIITTILGISRERAEALFEQTHLDDQRHRIPRELDLLKETVNRFSGEMRGTSRISFWSRSRVKPKLYEFPSLEVYASRSVGDVVFDYCCHPKTGDEIVAFLQDGKAHVHHKMCKHAASMMEKHEPMVFVRWKQQHYFRYHLIISMQSAQGSLADLLTYMAKMGADINSIELGKERTEHTQYCEMEFQTLEADINRLRSKLEKKGKIIQFFRTDDAYRSQG
ncbi:bifunctional (p)ppGpp synthetase/guanosine-3',5'-bis(diphosphate) 3'-pyrophosphohydrolase [Sulfuricurvum sp. IAE1]|uniref:RelA/SpoT family protein n=1 Tax=Sulfuricurvum sp. IAE1 TaxID=2546102 RepID=UPI0010532316|nr:RelA/SpoT family protein [Sulfuricurvum sp. IAE1]MDX9966312.1 RelA/SpoT family protein [Sulfuricurvum sp.]TDA69249.1 bifunctional (p)ppGpp synthetase/guanosine-3',5'-bis(diphosphate) 3'-pyrophosphohydrolase [Sulfuricurvum sp. IAE1]